MSSAAAAAQLEAHLSHRRGSGVLGLIGPRLLVLGSVMIALTAVFTANIQDPDFWWHLRDGQWILQHGALPSHDLYTFTASTHPWTDHEYLSEILIAVIYGWGGAGAISLTFGLVTWAGFLVIFLIAQAWRRPAVIAGAGLVLAALAGIAIWSPRVQMVTFFFACLELFWLHQFRDGHPRWLYAFPLAMALWANLHGGWAIGFAFLGVAIAAEAFELWRDDAGSRAQHTRSLRSLALVSVASVVAVAATPHGLSLFAYPFQTQGSAAQQNLIIEWLSPDFHQANMRAFEVMAFVTVAGFALRRPNVYELLLVLVTLALALQSVRHIVLFVAAATPVMISTWSKVWDAERGRLPWRPGPVPVSAFLSLLTASVLLGATIGSAEHIVVALEQQDQVTRRDFPVAAADWITTHSNAVGRRMYNQYGWGGYLAYRYYPNPDRRVFVFGDAELVGDTVLYDYAKVQGISPQWRAVLDHYGVDTVIYNRYSALAILLDSQPDWKLVYADSATVIYVRKSST